MDEERMDDYLDHDGGAGTPESLRAWGNLCTITATLGMGSWPLCFTPALEVRAS